MEIHSNELLIKLKENIFYLDFVLPYITFDVRIIVVCICVIILLILSFITNGRNLIPEDSSLN